MPYFLRHFAVICFLFITTVISAQELNFTVSVVIRGTVTVDNDLFKDLEKNITEFMNNNKWGEDQFDEHERVRGNIQLTITEQVSPFNFRGEMVFQTERPVYNSTYSTPIINLIDKGLNFQYNGIQPLLKTTNVFYDNLSSILSYYAYLALGFDYDSFSLYGGDLYFNKAYEVFSSLQANVVNDDGWRVDGAVRRNRYWLIENLLNPKLRPFRQSFYEYHRLCLDVMHLEVERPRAILLSALTTIGQANIEYPTTYLITMFGDTKKDEIVEIFLSGDIGQKNKVVNIMVGMDASKQNVYKKLQQ